jgi:hypothetical protein
MLTKFIFSNFVLMILTFCTNLSASTLESTTSLVKEVLDDSSNFGLVELSCESDESPTLNCSKGLDRSKIVDKTNELYRPNEWNGIENELTPYWAQEAIGSDLLKEYSSSPAPVTVLDSGFDIDDPNELNVTISSSVKNHQEQLMVLPESERRDQKQHGSKVSHLIGGKGSEGIASGAQLTSEQFTGNFYDDMDRILKESPSTKLINASVGVINQSPYNEELSKQLVEKNAIVVLGSGNSFPEKNTMNGTQGVITVGSLSPRGERSSFSQRPADINVPSDSLIVSRSGLRGTERFGGTSGAAPMVTGALSRVTAILPDLSAEAAKELMSLTGTSTHANLLNPKLNPPMLNSYRMEAVARRMLEKGIKPTVKNVRRLDPILLDFSSEIQDLKSKADLDLKKKPISCEEYRSALISLRKVALLSNENSDYLMVSEIYKKMGEVANARMYESLGKRDTRQLEIKLKKNLSSNDSELRALAFQTLSDSGKIPLKGYEDFLKIPGELDYFKRVALNGFIENHPKESSLWIKSEALKEGSWVSDIKDARLIMAVISAQARNGDYSLLQVLIDQDRDKKLKLIPSLDALTLVPLSQSGMKNNLTPEAFQRMSSLYPRPAPSNQSAKKKKD